MDRKKNKGNKKKRIKERKNETMEKFKKKVNIEEQWIRKEEMERKKIFTACSDFTKLERYTNFILFLLFSFCFVTI
jgi:hypothetical protein